MTDKERLERIIQMQYDGYTIWDMSENDLVWLIEQAERVQELEEEVFELKVRLEGAHKYNDTMKMIADDYEKENKRYKQALEEISKVGWSDSFGGGFSYTGENHAECVKIAKQALEGEK